MFETDAVRTMLRRAKLLELDDAGTQQLLKLSGMKGERLEAVPRIQHFGLSSNPPAGAEGIVAALGGRSDRAVLLGLEHPEKRPKAREAGSTVLYDAAGNVVSIVASELALQHGQKIRLRVGTMVVAISSSRIDLGADPAPYAVSTVGGPSSKVFAVI